MKLKPRDCTWGKIARCFRTTCHGLLAARMQTFIDTSGILVKETARSSMTNKGRGHNPHKWSPDQQTPGPESSQAAEHIKMLSLSESIFIQHLRVLSLPKSGLS